MNEKQTVAPERNLIKLEIPEIRFLVSLNGKQIKHLYTARNV